MVSMHRRTFLEGALSTAALGLSAGPLRVLADGRGGPESSGVASGAVLTFLQALAGSVHEPHSLMIQRHGRIVAQGGWAPYRADVAQSLYSLSKSFTSTAVGFAVAEGKLKVTDRVIDFFRDQAPAGVSEKLAALRVQHLLTMSVGHAIDSAPIITREQDWVKAFLAMPIEHAPGSAFLYDSGASYMLSALVRKACGETLLDYLRPRLFDPLELPQMQWATCPRGIDTGGWGLSATTETIAKFGRFYLQQGQWNGKQLLPKQWVAEATSAKIQQSAGSSGTPDADLTQLKQASDWHQGYGYQFWRCRHDAFRGDGAFGQFCIVLPSQNAVIAMTSCTADMQGLLNLIWEHLLPGMHDEPLPADAAASSRLQQELGALMLPLPKGASHSPTSSRVGSVRFDLEPNTLGARSVSLHFDHGSCVFELFTAENRFSIDCGFGRWREGETAMPGTPPEITELIGKTVSAPSATKVAAAGAWQDDNTLRMQWRYCGTPHHDIVTCRFDDNRIAVEFMNSITSLSRGAHAETRPVLKGRSVAAIR